MDMLPSQKEAQRGQVLAMIVAGWASSASAKLFDFFDGCAGKQFVLDGI